jgi:hypothetical protein
MPSKAEAAVKVQDLSNADTVADLQAKLRTAQEETSRALIQRDYFVRLLRQQQTLSTARTQNEVFTSLIGEHSIFARALKFLPRGFKELIPLRTKKFLKDVIVRIGFRSVRGI